MSNHNKPMTDEARKEWERRKAAMTALAGEISAACVRAGFILRTSFAQSRETSVPHWHFHVGDETIFHWWPTNGKWWNTTNNLKGVELDPWKTYRLACKAADDRIRAERHLASIQGR